MIWLLLLGCQASQVDDNRQLSHTNPPHWPQDLADARTKIAERFAIVRDNPASQPQRKELTEIIGWLPEIAADTDMPESDWQPIYDQSELIRLQLNNDVDFDKLQPAIEHLLELIRVQPKSID